MISGNMQTPGKIELADQQSNNEVSVFCSSVMNDPKVPNFI